MRHLFSATTFIAPITIFFAGTIHAEDFNFGGRNVTCAKSASYRDGQLYADFASAIENFDDTREAHINATIANFKADLRALTAGVEHAADAVARKIAVSVAGIVLGKAAEKLSTLGVKQTLSAVDKQAMKGDVDVTGIVCMPLSLLLLFSPFAVAEKAWFLGNSGIDIATVIAEAEIIKRELNLTAATTAGRADALAKKLQMPSLAKTIRLKNEVDKQCGRASLITGFPTRLWWRTNFFVAYIF